MTPSDNMTEYQEGNRIAIAYSQLTLMAGSIFISASFAIFGLSFTFQKPSPLSLVLMGVASGILYLIFLVYIERYKKYTHKIIFPMLRDLEKNMKMKFHTAIDEYDKLRKEACGLYYTILRIRFWNYFGFVTLIILWIVRIILSATF